MICPSCGSNVSNDKLNCPICGTELSSTQQIPTSSGRWCLGCGALLPLGAESCEKCGRPVEQKREEKPRAATRNLKLPDIDEDHPERVPSVRHRVSEDEVAHFESAIPDYDIIEEQSAQEAIPRGRAMFVSAMASLLIVGGAFLIVTHPWDPTRPDERATVGMDMSSAGGLEQIGSLQGQDSGERELETKSSADIILDQYERLGGLHDRLVAATETFEELCTSEDADARAKASEEAHTLAIELSNLIAEMGQVGGGGERTDDIENLVMLGNWLRNRMDSLLGAWAFANSFDDPASRAEDIQGFLPSTGSIEYLNLFEQNYADWKPSV